MSKLRGKFAKDYCGIVAKDYCRVIARAIRAKTHFKLRKQLMVNKKKHIFNYKNKTYFKF